MASKALSCLPLHLVSQILSKLHSIQTLGSVILSHPTFYAAFKDDVHSITYGILMSQMNFQNRTLYYAVVAYEACLVNYKDDTKVTAFIRDRFVTLASDPHFDFNGYTSHLRPDVAAALSKTQTVVDHFTKGFIHDALPRSRGELDIRASGNQYDCCDREFFRIQRAFYRYQTYCSLFFRNIDDLAESVCGMLELDYEVTVIRKPFFYSHSPWENEQLACILDYLENLLSRAFDQVAKCDIVWGAHQVDWMSEGFENRQKQAYLSLGLAYLHKLDRAKDYPSQYRILTKEGYQDSGLRPPGTSMTIPCLMKLIYPLYDDNLRSLGEATLRELTDTQLRAMQSLWLTRVVGA